MPILSSSQKTFLIFIVLAVLNITLAPAEALAVSNLTINSSPQGADAYCLTGACTGLYLGTTPFVYDTQSNGGITWMKIVKSGYQDGGGAIYSYMNDSNTLMTFLLTPVSSPSPSTSPSPSLSPSPSSSPGPSTPPSPSTSPGPSTSPSPTPTPIPSGVMPLS